MEELTTALVKVRDEYSSDEVALIKQTIAKGTTDLELQLFLSVARQTGLNPLAKQIYPVIRKDKNGEKAMTIQTGIDGYRAIADRTGLYAGSDDYTYDEGLSMYDHIKTERGHPITATATVYKIVGGMVRPFTRTAAWKAYCPQQDFMWKKMDHFMLGKCAEALALRAAFPQQLNKVYVQEEMQQAMDDYIDVPIQNGTRNGKKPSSSPVPVEMVSDQPAEFPPKQISSLEAAMKAAGVPIKDAQGNITTAGKLKGQKQDALLWQYWNQYHKEESSKPQGKSMADSEQLTQLAEIIGSCGDLLGSKIPEIEALRTDQLMQELSDAHDACLMGMDTTTWAERSEKYANLLRTVQSFIPA